MSHADAILRHSVMDEYILDVLSGYHMNKDLELAIATMMDKIERFPDLLYLNVAGLIRVGNYHEQLGQSDAAAHCYRDVLSSTEAHWKEKSLEPYLKLAHGKIAF